MSIRDFGGGGKAFAYLIGMAILAAVTSAALVLAIMVGVQDSGTPLIGSDRHRYRTCRYHRRHHYLGPMLRLLDSLIRLDMPSYWHQYTPRLRAQSCRFRPHLG